MRQLTMNDLKNTSFSEPIKFENNDNDLLEVWNNKNDKHSWASKFGMNFNGGMKFFNTLTALNLNASKLINKHNLTISKL